MPKVALVPTARTRSGVKVNRAFRVHATNILGLGASELVNSLLPAFERSEDYQLAELYLPDHGPVARYVCQNPEVLVTQYRRFLPNALSRALECTILGYRFSGRLPMIVLGDIPLRANTKQIVFIQTPHLFTSEAQGWSVRTAKQYVMRKIFRSNLHFAAAFVVQTEYMRKSLVTEYPVLNGRVHVIAQPVAPWVAKSGLIRRSRRNTQTPKLRLFYPAASYPHKNHGLLKDISAPELWPVGALVLTIPPDDNPNPNAQWLRCTGRLDREGVLDEYSSADALLFLSLAESYGFPLIEAMFLGLPIICADLPYARALCGDGAIYFDPRNSASLLAATQLLKSRFDEAWWPDWTAQLAQLPQTWDEVARDLVALTDTVGSSC